MMNPRSVSFGRLLASYRAARNLSQEELANRYSAQFALISAQQLNEIEQDREDPKPITGFVGNIALLLGINVADLEAAAAQFKSAGTRQLLDDKRLSFSAAAFRKVDVDS